MYGDISGGSGYGGSGRRAVGPADFYRRVPPSMTEVSNGRLHVQHTHTSLSRYIHHNNCPPLFSHTQATRVGVIMSIVSLLFMTSLFLCETYEFAWPRITSSIELDNPRDPGWDEGLLRLNFNVSLFDVHCEFVSVGEFAPWLQHTLNEVPSLLHCLRRIFEMDRIQKITKRLWYNMQTSGTLSARTCRT